MAGVLGVPGLDGYRAALFDNQQRDLSNIQAMRGVLGIQGQLQEQQMLPLKLEQLKMQLERQKQNLGIIGGIMGGMGGMGGAPTAEQALAQGAAQGDVGPTVTNAQRMQPQGSQSNGLDLPPQIQMAMLSGDPGLEKWAAAMAQQYKPTDKIREAIALGMKPGTQQFNAYVGTAYNQGGAWQVDPATGGVKLAPGYAEGQGAVKGAEAAATAAYGAPIQTTLNVNGKVMPVSLTPLEYKKYTETGDIPARFGGSPVASPSGNATISPSVTLGEINRISDPNDRAAALDAYQNGRFEPRRGVTGGGIPTRAVIGMGQDSATTAASTEMAGIHAKRVGALEEKIPTLNGTLRRLDRVEALTKDDKTYAAAGAELKTQLGSIAQGFGLKINADKTASTEQYIADLAELLKDRLASKDYGSGTGISNLDLATAGRPLPEVVKTAQGRMLIIDAIRKDTKRALEDATAARQYFAQNKTLDGFTYPSETAQDAAPPSNNGAGKTRPPAVGEVINGYVYLGGDRNNRSSYRPVSSGSSGGF